jgi:hypothetical protein
MPAWKPSGHYMYSQFNIQQFYVLPTQCIYVFCVDLRTNSDISLYSINWLVCITETESVYCAVRTRTLNTIQVNLMHLIASLPPRRPGFDPSPVHVRFVVKKVDRIFSSTPVPPPLLFHQCSTLIHQLPLTLFNFRNMWRRQTTHISFEHPTGSRSNTSFLPVGNGVCSSE